MAKIQTVDDRILKFVISKADLSVFVTRQFANFGSPVAIRQALSRLVKAGKLRRIRRGLYDVLQSHPIIGTTAPDPMAVVHTMMDGSSAKWQSSGAYAANLLGLSDQVPAKIVILTDGAARRISLGKLTIAFRRTSPRNLLGAGTPAGMVIQAIRYLRADGIGVQQIDHLRKLLDADTKRGLVKLMSRLPAWMQPIIQRITG